MLERVLSTDFVGVVELNNQFAQHITQRRPAGQSYALDHYLDRAMRGTSKPAAVCLAVAVLLASCAGCSSSTPPAHAATAPVDGGTVTGTLRLAGGPQPGTDRATTGEVYAFPSPSLSGQLQLKAKTADDGSFRLNLPAGTYYLAATSPDFSIDPPPAAPPCRGDKPAVVTRGGTSRVDVVCQMK